MVVPCDVSVSDLVACDDCYLSLLTGLVADVPVAEDCFLGTFEVELAQMLVWEVVSNVG